jgi:hypothetical protein
MRPFRHPSVDHSTGFFIFLLKLPCHDGMT